MSVPLALYQGPWPMRSRALTAGRPGLRAQIGVPGARARCDRGGERLAVRVGAREAAQVAALARAGAGDEEAHALWRVLRPGGGKSEH